MKVLLWFAVVVLLLVGATSVMALGNIVGCRNGLPMFSSIDVQG